MYSQFIIKDRISDDVISIINRDVVKLLKSQWITNNTEH